MRRVCVCLGTLAGLPTSGYRPQDCGQSCTHVDPAQPSGHGHRPATRLPDEQRVPAPGRSARAVGQTANVGARGDHEGLRSATLRCHLRDVPLPLCVHLVAARQVAGRRDARRYPLAAPKRRGDGVGHVAAFTPAGHPLARAPPPARGVQGWQPGQPHALHYRHRHQGHRLRGRELRAPLLVTHPPEHGTAWYALADALAAFTSRRSGRLNAAAHGCVLVGIHIVHLPRCGRAGLTGRAAIPDHASVADVPPSAAQCRRGTLDT
mmetsp:Transcript_50605/g.131647  ORF Transcript_50605/g.131647 Transcript_50605/m.131647 type:complete len:264 (-) Transcript_50605:540-1331(-)